MTAVVGILNKQAVALAADSAVTISGQNNRKIFNRANKIFTLSKYHPVGIMIYNSASFMTTPWETIIKVYRKQLGDKSFGTIEEYQIDFIEFIRGKNFYSDAKVQKFFLGNIFNGLLDFINKEALKNHGHLLLAATPENQAEILRLIEQKLDEFLQQLSTNEFCSEFQDYSYEEFDDFSAAVTRQVISQLYLRNGFTLGDVLIRKIKNVLHLFLRTKENNTPYTGLIFVGFGDEEIYPSLIPINVSLAVQNRLRFFKDEKMVAKVSNENNGAIRPFAQIDVINTILTGIDPVLDTTYLENFSKFFQKYNQEILRTLGNETPVLSEQIRKLDINKLTTEYAKKNQEVKQTNYIKPLMNAVSNLSKEDLAEMAESLIYLTYLKRRITFSEESVGGPVDVAIISKGDGFIWIKRKHYFKPELNQHFFDKYFN